VTRRFDIGPVLLALAALVLLVSLFLPWLHIDAPAGASIGDRGDVNAWEAFEITDLLLAALAIAAIVAALGLMLPDVDYVDRRWIPWIVGAAFVLVVDQILRPDVVFDSYDHDTGAWLALGATVVMIIGAVLSLAKVHVNVAVEGRDRRRRVSAVDHRPPPTETGAQPVQRTSLLHDPPGDEDAGSR
jgi:hypothetical protein